MTPILFIVVFGMALMLLTSSGLLYWYLRAHSWQRLHSRAKDLYQRQLLSQAASWAEKALAVAEKSAQNNPHALVTSLRLVAAIRQQEGLYEEAEQDLARALSRAQSLEPSDIPVLADSFCQQAELYLAWQKPMRAINCFTRALKVLEEAQPQDADAQIPVLVALGDLHLLRGNWLEAELNFGKALALHEPTEIDEQLSGQLHQKLGDCLLNQDQSERAEPLYLKALAYQEENLGTDHPDVATTLKGLGELFRRRGRHQKALRLFRRALQIREHALGPEHPLVAEVLDALADSLGQSGKHGEAEPLLSRSLAIVEKSWGEGAKEVSIAVDRLAENYQHQGKLSEAEKLYQRFVSSRRPSGQADELEFVSQLEKLAKLSQEQGDLLQALEHSLQALNLREEIQGEMHPEVADSLEYLATLHQERGGVQEARRLRQRAETIRNNNRQE